MRVRVCVDRHILTRLPSRIANAFIPHVHIHSIRSTTERCNVIENGVRAINTINSNWNRTCSYYVCYACVQFVELFPPLFCTMCVCTWKMAKYSATTAQVTHTNQIDLYRSQLHSRSCNKCNWIGNYWLDRMHYEYECKTKRKKIAIFSLKWFVIAPNAIKMCAPTPPTLAHLSQFTPQTHRLRVLHLIFEQQLKLNSLQTRSDVLQIII